MKINFDKNDNIQPEPANYDKSILQFFSGGADGTFLLLQNLRCNHKVTLTYVNITNNGKKPEREKEARNLLKDDIEKFCEYFNCIKPIYMKDHSITVNYPLSRCNAPQQIIFGMFALLMGRGYDEIHMGVVLGDSMRGVNLNSDLVEVYNKNISGFIPDIKYPIADISKEVIYLTLQGYDNLLGTKFLEHITVCENIDKLCGKDKECMPCKTQQEVFKRLKWVE